MTAGSVLIGSILEVIFGDPEGWPHPVRALGLLIMRLESVLRRLQIPERLAGIALVAISLFLSTGTVFLASVYAHGLHSYAGLLFDGFVLYLSISLNQLLGEARLIASLLTEGNLDAARRNLMRLVSRRTDDLDESGIVRAALESTTENFSDGFAAPVFYFLVAGPAGAVAYRTINTLDSMVGYRNEKYIRLGWASARLDDLMNFIPARLAALFIVAAAGLMGLRFRSAMRVWLRDARNHESPNAAQCEAAAAGALGIQLGGTVEYENGRVQRPMIGDCLAKLTPSVLIQCSRLLAVAGLLVLCAAILLVTALTT